MEGRQPGYTYQNLHFPALGRHFSQSFTIHISTEKRFGRSQCRSTNIHKNSTHDRLWLLHGTNLNPSYLTRKSNSLESTYTTPKEKPPYLLGLLCIIPLVGAFAGFVMILLGAIKYRDKWFTLIGIAGIGWTVLVYGGLFYFGLYSSESKKGFSELSKMQMSNLVKSIEFYKLQHGQYPDNLHALQKDDPMAAIYDPAPGLRGFVPFRYKKMGTYYSLFSSGPDAIAGTRDDLYPEFTVSDSTKIGLRNPGR